MKEFFARLRFRWQTFTDRVHVAVRIGRRNLPADLIKATEDDYFDYAVGLRNGQVIQFRGASIDGQWVTLKGITKHTVPVAAIDDQEGAYYNRPFTFERGLQVRLAEIVWIADAPFGS